MFIKRFNNLSIIESFRDTIYVGVGSLIGAFFSYLLLFALGRKLSIEDFGTYNALFALANIISIPASVLSISIAKSVSEFYSKKDIKRITDFFRVLTVYSLLVGIIVFLIILLLRGYISTSLRIYDTMVVAAFGLMTATIFLGSIPTPYFQGLLRFRASSFYTVLSSFFRFSIPVTLVFLGFKLYGAFIGITIAGIFSFLFALHFLKKSFVDFSEIDARYDYRKVLLFSVPALFVTLSMTFLTNIDMILVKRFFNPTLTGYYAGALTVGKILLFGSGIITTVMFPVISSLYTKGEDFMEKFKQFALIQISVVGAGLLIFLLIPGFLTHLFFGAQFSHSVSYLPLFSVLVSLFVMVNFLVMFFLAINRTKIFVFLIPGAVIQFLLITLFHSNLYQIIYADIISVSVTLLLLVVFLIKEIKHLSIN